jgi:hypothetical protein
MNKARFFSQSFMKPQVYRGSYFSIETSAGTEIVPSDVIGRTVGTDVSAFADYLEGNPQDDDEVIECQEGWLARMSAPGYMDCTAWEAHKTEDAAWDSLVENYGETPVFEYFINTDERGDFAADVRDASGRTVWETNGEVFEDGFMKDKNDLDGLRDYLVSLGIMEDGDELNKGQ